MKTQKNRFKIGVLACTVVGATALWALETIDDDLQVNGSINGTSKIIISKGLAAGESNSTQGDHWRLIAGNSNTISGNTYAIALGNNNTISYGAECIPIGQENEVSGWNSMVFGKGLINHSGVSKGSVFVGRYNKTSYASERVFVVGIGDDDANRADGLIIKDNGDIVIPKAQGDISMGVYGQ